LGAAVPAGSADPEALGAHGEKAYRTDLAEVLALVAEPLGCGVDQVPVAGLTRDAVRSGFARFAISRSASSVARAWSTWNGWFAFPLSHRVVKGNPMQAIRRPKGSAKQPKPLQGEDNPGAAARRGRCADPEGPDRVAGARGGGVGIAAVHRVACTAELLRLLVLDLVGRPGSYRIGVPASSAGR
jgi:integrase/recombinase XerD